jgi:hypothetical protein
MILVREGTELPGTVRLESEPYEAGWRLVRNLDGYGLGREIHEAGWTFFCQAGDIRAIAFGIDEQRVRRAVKRILAKVAPGKFNCLEITRVATQRFFGVPYASVRVGLFHPSLYECVVMQQKYASLMVFG